jgi:Icc protein
MMTVLQMSDLHLMRLREATLHGVPTAESFRLVLQRARAEVPDPARVVLTGDLSHQETDAGYVLLKELLGDWNERTLFIPGNHDSRVALRSVFGLTGTPAEEVLFCDRVGNWILVGLDTQIPGVEGGRISATSIERLRTLLAVSAECNVVLFMHHPPISVNSTWIDEIGLSDASELEIVLRGHNNIRCIFCGHVHQVFRGLLAAVPVLTAPSTAFQFKPETAAMEFDNLSPGFRVIEMKEDSFTTRIVRLGELAYPPLRFGPGLCEY